MQLTENKTAASGFEEGFLAQPLQKQIKDCDGYELASLFESIFEEHQPVLEAGSGSGRWCGWFSKKNIKSDGIDWSKELIKRAQIELPESEFMTGDMRNVPKPDSFYGGIIALGSVEHSTEGPISALNEFSRVLKNGGLAVVTVPYGGFLRRKTMDIKKILKRLKKDHPEINQILTNIKWYPKWTRNKEGVWEFFEYEFNKTQMRNFISQTNFEIMQEFVAFKDEGVLHNFGRLSGKWNEERCGVDFTILGKLLRIILPVSIIGHMLCYVLKNNKK